MNIRKHFTKQRTITIIGNIALIAALVLPFVALAAGDGLQDLLGDFMRVLNDVAIPMLIAIEIIIFIVGVIRYFMNPDTDRTEASRFLMFTISAIFATVALLGLVFLIQRSIGVGSGGTIQPPALPETVVVPR